MIAYQSRVHSAKGYTHFEQMFGRNMIPFNDYSNENEDSNAWKEVRISKNNLKVHVRLH